MLDHDLTTAAVWPQIVDGVHRGHGDSAHRPYHDASSLEVNQGATESEANLPFVCENVNKIQQYVIVLRSRNRRLPRKHTSLCCCALQALVLYSRIRTYTPLPCRNVAAAAAGTPRGDFEPSENMFMKYTPLREVGGSLDLVHPGPDNP